MINLIIKNEDSGQRLNKYLMKYLKDAPSSFIYKMLRKKNIVLNGKKAKGDEIISEGDEIKLFLSDETIMKFKGNSQSTSGKTKVDLSTNGNNKVKCIEINVLYEDKDVIAVHKDMGVLSQKAKSTDYSINEAIVDYIYSNKSKYNCSDTFKPSVCNRLDMNTSGIILAGITLKGSQYLSKALKDRTFDKYYYTVVKGSFKKAVLCKGYISKDTDINKSNVISEDEYNRLNNMDIKNYSPIETEFVPLHIGDKCTLLKIKLITGKSHQIRAHLSKLGYPVAGDAKYGDKVFNKYMKETYKLNNHLLHAGQVKLSKDVVINDPLPDLFKRVCMGEGLNCRNI